MRVLCLLIYHCVSCPNVSPLAWEGHEDRRELSPDLKTLTRTVQPIGQGEPAVFVFERQ